MKTLGRAACSAVLALELVAYATSALASSCSVALARFNGLIKVNDDWYYDAFKKAMGAATSRFTRPILLSFVQSFCQSGESVCEGNRMWW
jgi:hypothetical protein